MPKPLPGDLAQRYFLHLGASFVRGSLEDVGDLESLDDLDAFRRGVEAGLRMHKFKRTMELPRVRRVLAMLAGLAPESLLDIGSGRGAFLWPLLDAFPGLPVTAVDHDETRARDLAAVSRGGVTRLTAACMDACALELPDGAVDGVTLLEVLEHLPTPGRAAREAVRVSRRFVIASVPSGPDENPQHIHLFDRGSLTALLETAGARNVRLEWVRGHAIVLALTGTSRHD